MLATARLKERSDATQKGQEEYRIKHPQTKKRRVQTKASNSDSSESEQKEAIKASIRQLETNIGMHPGEYTGAEMHLKELRDQLNALERK